MVPTEALRHELEACGFRSLKVVPRGVDTERFTPARRCEALRAQWGAAPARRSSSPASAAWRPRRTSACCWTPTARSARLLPVRACCSSATARCERRCESVCPEAIFAGQRSGLDLAAHYASADLFLFPSLTETFGNVTHRGAGQRPAGAWPSTMRPQGC